MKKIILKSVATLVLGISFTACGVDDSGSSDFDYLIPDKKGGTSIDEALKVTKIDSGENFD